MTRQTPLEIEHSLDSPPHCVQIVCDIYQASDRFHQVDWNAIEVPVRRAEPKPRLFSVTADQGIEAPKYAHEKRRELIFRAPLDQLLFATHESRDGGRADAEDFCQFLLR